MRVKVCEKKHNGRKSEILCILNSLLFVLVDSADRDFKILSTIINQT